MERETGIEPATNSLEGCDSTTELLPPSPHPRAVPALRLGCHPKLETLRCRPPFARIESKGLVGREGFEPS
jgi:hypothetical protein